jgi:hypothetical protein
VDEPFPERKTFRQARREVTVEPLPDTLTLRYRDDATRDEVRDGLVALGARVRDVPPARLLVCELPDAEPRAAAVARIANWRRDGAIEFVTPAVRDAGSGLLQLITDEITVRFASPPTAETVKTLESDHGVELVRRNEFAPTQVVVRVADADGLKALDVASALDGVRGVAFAAPNFVSQHDRRPGS